MKETLKRVVSKTLKRQNDPQKEKNRLLIELDGLIASYRLAKKNQKAGAVSIDPISQLKSLVHSADEILNKADNYPDINAKTLIVKGKAALALRRTEQARECFEWAVALGTSIEDKAIIEIAEKKLRSLPPTSVLHTQDIGKKDDGKKSDSSHGKWRRVDARRSPIHGQNNAALVTCP